MVIQKPIFVYKLYAQNGMNEIFQMKTAKDKNDNYCCSWTRYMNRYGITIRTNLKVRIHPNNVFSKYSKHPITKVTL